MSGGGGFPYPHGLKNTTSLRALVLAVLAAGLFQRLDAPWTGMHDWNGAFHSLLGKNLLRYPIDVTRGLPVVAVGRDAPPPDARRRYATHPPGLVYLVAGAFAVLGESERSARLIPIAATLASAWLLMSLVFGSYGRAASVWAGLLFATLPLVAYFGRMVNHEPVCLFFMLLALWGAVAQRRLARWAGLSVGVIGAIWIDWPGLLFAGLLVGWLLWRVRRGAERTRTVVTVGAIAVVATLPLLALLAGGGFDGDGSAFFSALVSRSGDAPPPRFEPRGAPWTYTLENFTWSGLVLALAGLGWHAAWRASRDRRRLSNGWLAVLALTGAIWLVALWPLFARHNYWQFYLAPVAAVCGGVFLAQIPRLGRWAGRAAPAAGALAIVAGFIGSADYFDRRGFPEGAVAFWKDFRARHADAPVLLFRDPRRVERHGPREYWNLVPPQEMYYMDRAFDVARDAGAVRAATGRFAAFVVPIEEQHASWPVLQQLMGDFGLRQAYPFPYFELELTKAAGSDARQWSKGTSIPN